MVLELLPLTSLLLTGPFTSFLGHNLASEVTVLFFRQAFLFLYELLDLPDHAVQYFVAYHLTLASEHLSQIMPRDIALLISVKVVERETQIFFSESARTIDCGCQEL